VAGEQETALKGKTQYPLTDGLLWYYLTDLQCGAYRHASRTTAGAETATLAAECNQLIMVAVGALHPQETVLQPATLR